jgi:hypothetical protein
MATTICDTGRMGVGPRYLCFLIILKGMGLSAYTGWTTLPDLSNYLGDQILPLGSGLVIQQLNNLLLNISLLNIESTSWL